MQTGELAEWTGTNAARCGIPLSWPLAKADSSPGSVDRIRWQDSTRILIEPALEPFQPNSSQRVEGNGHGSAYRPEFFDQ